MTSVVLVGNGISIAYNQGLAIRPLTERILSAFDAGDGAILTGFAQGAGAQDSSFESVLGALDQISVALPLLIALNSEGLAVDSRTEVLNQSAQLLSEIYRTGLGHSLETIDGLAQNNSGDIDGITALADELADLDDLTIATLNYDGLLPSRLLEGPGTVYDLAAGYEPSSFIVIDDCQRLDAFRLRDRDDLRAPTLINLHGSMGWLRHPDHGWWRFRVQDLRRVGFWQALRENRTDWLPVVVLTNQHRKSEIVGTYPFRLAYEAFRQRIDRCDRLAIIGYGFGDMYLNHILQESLGQSSRSPELLVVTHGDHPSVDEVRARLCLRTGRSFGMLDVGIPDSMDTELWRRWKAC